MKNIAIVTADIHVHKYKQFNQNNRRLINVIGYINYLFKFAYKNEINWILFSGDLYNNMQLIGTEAEDIIIECFHRNFQANPHITWVAISGNHDHATKNLKDAPAKTALRHLSVLFPGFLLIDNSAVTIEGVKIHGIPYYEYPEHFMDSLEYTVEQAIKHEPKNNILLMHQLVGMDNSLILEDINPDHKYLQSFHTVFNGHVHKHSEVRENFINVGSPLHRDAGDIGIPKGFLLFAFDTLEWDYYDLTDKYPQYIHKTIGEELTDWEKNQYVIWVPSKQEVLPEDQEIVDNFSSDIKPEKLFENYVRAALSDDEAKELGVNKDELIEFGLSYL